MRKVEADGCGVLCVLGCHTLASSIFSEFLCGHFDLPFFSIKLAHPWLLSAAARSVSAAASLFSAGPQGADSACNSAVPHVAGYAVSAQPLESQ